MELFNVETIDYAYELTNVHHSFSIVNFNEEIWLSNNTLGEKVILSSDVLGHNFISFTKLNESDAYDSLYFLTALNEIFTSLSNYHNCRPSTDEWKSVILPNTLSKLNNIFESNKYLLYLYPRIYNMLCAYNNFFSAASTDNDTLQTMRDNTTYILAEIELMKKSFNSTRDFVNGVFLIPQNKSIYQSTYKLIISHFIFSSSEKIPNIIKELYSNNNEENYDQFLANNDLLVTQEHDDCIISSITDFIKANISLLLEGNLSIRRCYNCHNLFITKSNNETNYCNKIFTSTSTCSEYISKKNYRLKLIEDSISAEYTRAYNQLYARIRRGNVPSDTPLKDKLIELRDIYRERYEHTHGDARELVWREYIQKNKELLNPSKKKS